MVFFTSPEMNFMEDKPILADTNIIVYAFDAFDKRKHEICKSLVEKAFKGEIKLAVSNQVLAELFFVLTKKLKTPFIVEEAETIVSGIIDSVNWVKINYNHETVKKTTALSRSKKISIWDSLIVSTALEHDITKIYTENVKDFKETSITAINPFNK